MIKYKLLKYLLILFLANIVFQFINISLVEKKLLIDLRNFKDLEFASFSDYFSVFYLLVIFSPIFEEFSLRLLLVKKEREILIGLASLIIIILYKLINYVDLVSLSHLENSILIIISISLVYFSLKKFTRKITDFFNPISVIGLLVFTSIVFGLLHYGTNYSSPYFFISLIPLAKHVFSGLIFGIFRLNYGFRNGILLHSLNNLLAFLAIIL